MSLEGLGEGFAAGVDGEPRQPKKYSNEEIMEAIINIHRRLDVMKIEFERQQGQTNQKVDKLFEMIKLEVRYYLKLPIAAINDGIGKLPVRIAKMLGNHAIVQRKNEND